MSQRSRRRIDFGAAGGSTLVIASGTIPSASRAPATVKGRNEAGANAAQQQLAARRGGEGDDLVDAVKRAAVGVVALALIHDSITA